MATRQEDERRWPRTLRNMVQQPVPATIAPLEPSGAFRLGQFLRQAPASAVQGVGQAATSAAAAVRDRAAIPLLTAGQDFYFGISGRDVPPVLSRALPAPQSAPAAAPRDFLLPADRFPVSGDFSGLMARPTAAPVEAPISRPVAAPTTVAAQPAPAVDRATPFGAVFPARGGQAGYTVTVPQAERAGQRVNVLPSSALAGGGIGAGGVAAPAQARSAMLDKLYADALARVNNNQLRSYGDLFNRKRDMNTLAQLGPLVQAGGTNVVQAAGDELSANVSLRGQDLGYASNLGQQNVAREGNILQADTSRYGTDVAAATAAGQQATTLRGYMIQGEATTAAARIKAAQDLQKLAIENPLYPLVSEAATGYTRDENGKRVKLTKAEHDERIARYQALKFSPNGLDLLGLGAQ